MTGIVAGLIGSLKVTSSGVLTNLITNGSLTVDATGWTANGLNFRDASVFNSSPASYNTGYGDEDGAIAEYVQNGIVSAGNSYSMSLWIRNNNAVQSLTLVLQLGTGSYLLNTATYPISTTWQKIVFENKLCLTNSNFSFYIYGNGTGAFNIDDVSLVLGPTAL